MATIRQRNNTFEVRFRLNGRQISRSFPSAIEAKRFAAACELGLDGQMMTPSGPKRTRSKASQANLTLLGALDRYWTEVVSHQKGARQARYRLEHIKRQAFAQKPIDQVTAEDIRQFRDSELARCPSGATVLRVLTMLSALFEHARAEYVMSDIISPLVNPVSAIKKPRPSKPRVVRLSSDDEKRLMESLGSSKNRELVHFVRFALETGMRRGEILRLRPSDIDLERRVVWIEDSKNGQSRFVPLTDEAIAVINTLGLKGHKLFSSSESALSQAWEHAKTRVGLKPLRIHDLRHEALSRWAHRLKGDTYKLALISGHKTLQMTMKYVHPVYVEMIASQESVNGGSE